MSQQDLQVKKKKEHAEEEGEKTKVGRYYSPQTDVHESSDALFISMEMPGVQRDNISIQLEKNVLTITGTLDFSNYEQLRPIYTEYNVGNYSRRFSLSSQIDKEGISAKFEDGVLGLTLPKAREATARTIRVQ